MAPALSSEEQMRAARELQQLFQNKSGGGGEGGGGGGGNARRRRKAGSSLVDAVSQAHRNVHASAVGNRAPRHARGAGYPTRTVEAPGRTYPPGVNLHAWGNPQYIDPSVQAFLNTAFPTNAGPRTSPNIESAAQAAHTEGGATRPSVTSFGQPVAASSAKRSLSVSNDTRFGLNGLESAAHQPPSIPGHVEASTSDQDTSAKARLSSGVPVATTTSNVSEIAFQNPGLGAWSGAISSGCDFAPRATNVYASTNQQTAGFIRLNYDSSEMESAPSLHGPSPFSSSNGQHVPQGNGVDENINCPQTPVDEGDLMDLDEPVTFQSASDFRFGANGDLDNFSVPSRADILNVFATAKPEHGNKVEINRNRVFKQEWNDVASFDFIDATQRGEENLLGNPPSLIDSVLEILPELKSLTPQQRKCCNCGIQKERFGLDNSKYNDERHVNPPKTLNRQVSETVARLYRDSTTSQSSEETRFVSIQRLAVHLINMEHDSECPYVQLLNRRKLDLYFRDSPAPSVVIHKDGAEPEVKPSRPAPGFYSHLQQFGRGGDARLNDENRLRKTSGRGHVHGSQAYFNKPRTPQGSSDNISVLQERPFNSGQPVSSEQIFDQRMVSTKNAAAAKQVGKVSGLRSLDASRWA